MAAGDWDAVERIYAAGIAGGSATFAESPPPWEEFLATRIPGLSLVAVDGSGAVLGWAAATPTSTRDVYRGVIEHSVYVDPAAAGRGVGGALLRGLAGRARALGYWTIQSSILAENPASLALHGKAGFRTVGRRERIGLMSYGPYAGSWRDTILVELRL
ncbi:GNAT family N-acetyltransferase [Arthrobacter sp. SDTb3-6]|uniref:GNAT family N-acetyltransferase n=2 Tax=unclassified Arthrobacter TaxID=235627 RepID=UPI00159D2D7C|nr:GNAT family N-acetyltransferase [Arthrobacter sp. SDTb3-6]NVM98764.1 N-acetyltransferase [Arthrobacter sp. SDTb3-6]